jgi:hypothetical protein
MEYHLQNFLYDHINNKPTIIAKEGTTMYIPFAINETIKPIIPAININQPKIKIKLKLNSTKILK